MPEEAPAPLPAPPLEPPRAARVPRAAPAPDPDPAQDPAQDSGPAPTHDLVLSDGRTVPSRGAIPTHYAEGDQVFRVVRVTKR